MAPWRNIKCHQNIVRIYFFIRQAGKVRPLQEPFLLTQRECAGTPLAQKQGGPWTDCLMCTGAPFPFSKRSDPFTQITPCLSLLLASCDNLAQKEWLSLRYLLSIISLHLPLEVTLHPHDLTLLSGERELGESSLAYFVFTRNSFLSYRKRGIDY